MERHLSFLGLLQQRSSRVGDDDGDRGDDDGDHGDDDGDHGDDDGDGDGDESGPGAL